MKTIKLLAVILLPILFLLTGCEDESNPTQPTNNAPSTPSSPNPANGSTDISRSPVLSWTCSDPDAGDSVKYDLFFSPINPPNTAIASNWLNPNYAMTGLDSNRTYYWRVTAKDLKGASSVGPIWRFTTTGGFPTQGLIAYYPFNGNANDESGNGNNGTVNGATLTSDRFGLLNNAYSFNGTSNYITLPTAISLTYDFSISFWMKTTQSDPGGGLGAKFLISRDLPGYQRDWCIGLGNGSKIQFSTGTQTNDYTLLSTMDINDNTWKHIVIIRNVVATSKKIYINGLLNNSTTFDNQSFVNNSNYIYLGTNYSMVGFYKGDLDDIRIFNRALSETEIQALYHEGGWQ